MWLCWLVNSKGASFTVLFGWGCLVFIELDKILHERHHQVRKFWFISNWIIWYYVFFFGCVSDDIAIDVSGLHEYYSYIFFSWKGHVLQAQLSRWHSRCFWSYSSVAFVLHALMVVDGDGVNCGVLIRVPLYCPFDMFEWQLFCWEPD